MGDEKPRALQNPDVLHHRASVQRLLEVLAKLAGGTTRLLEKIKDLAPSRVRQRLEHEVILGRA
jgi:hypothetical protein